jgi:hypothetical protein
MKAVESDEVLCTVVFRLKDGQSGAGRFIYGLACQVERWQAVEVLSLSVGDLHYEKDELPTHGGEDDSK